MTNRHKRKMTQYDGNSMDLDMTQKKMHHQNRNLIPMRIPTTIQGRMESLKVTTMVITTNRRSHMRSPHAVVIVRKNLTSYGDHYCCALRFRNMLLKEAMFAVKEKLFILVVCVSDCFNTRGNE